MNIQVRLIYFSEVRLLSNRNTRIIKANFKQLMDALSNINFD